MAKYFSFIAENVTPLSQNNRTTARVTGLGIALSEWHNKKYSANTLPYASLIESHLEAKVFYLHRVKDTKDADNISKPLWDSLNQVAYHDDKKIKYLETLKIDINEETAIEMDLTSIDNHDFEKLCEFLFDPTTTIERILYVAISDLDIKKVRTI